MTDAEALEKAKKLKVLTEQGATEGERNAARTVLAKFLLRYPHIKPLLDAHTAPPPPPPPPRPPGPDASGAFGFPPWGQGGTGFRPSGKAAPPKPAAGGGFMGNVWDFIQGAAQSLRDGMTLREQIRDITTVDTVANSRTLTFRVSMSVRDLEDLLDEAGPEQDEAVATIFASLVREDFVRILKSMDTDDSGL